MFDQRTAGTGPIAPMPPNAPVLPSSATFSTPPIEQGTTGGRLPPNYERLRGLGARLATDFKTYENHRKLAELRWSRNLRQFLGEYDPEVLKGLEANRSKAYPRVTRVKCVSMLARLMNLLFPTTEKNWGLEASPVPNLEMQDLQMVLQQAQAMAQQMGKPLNDSAIESAVRAFAGERAKNLEVELDDQLQEIGGTRHLSYVALCRQVLFSGILYGVGVLKGPFVRRQPQRTWSPDAQGIYMPQQIEAYRPQFEFVPIWDYYPDMTSKHLHNMDGQFHRKVMTKTQMRELADRQDFFGEIIKAYLLRVPKGNWREKTYESDLRTMGVQSQVNILSSTKYEILVWDGMVSSEDLRAANIELPNGLPNDMVDASVWTIDGEVIKCDMSPWVELEPEQRVMMYHHFVFEEDDSNLLGNGLPNIMRDSQMGVSAATRMLLDNASIVCGPNLEVNLELLRRDQDTTAIVPYKLWYREDDSPATASIPAVKNIPIDSHIQELKEVIELFQQNADMETFVNPATGGDMQKGPSEPFRTAAGASMIQGQAALPFKDVVRNYDEFTISVINSLVVFNRHFNADREVQGDFSVVARGSSSLIAKEVRGMALDMLAQTVQPEERKYIDWYKLIQERLIVRDVDVTSVLLDADAAKEVEQSEREAHAKDAAAMAELMKAEVRKLLAEAAKAVTGADVNTAKVQTETYNTILAGLESGVTPVDVAAAHAGGEMPAAIAAGHRLKSGKDRPPSTANGSKK